MECSRSTGAVTAAVAAVAAGATGIDEAVYPA